MKKLSLVLALMIATLFGGLFIESASAGQNTNSSTTMNSNMGNMNMGRRHRRHWRRHRRHYRRRMGRNANT